jgi:hypothetical protein
MPTSSWDASDIDVFIVGLDVASAQARVFCFVEEIETGLRRLGMKKYTIYQTRNTVTLDFPKNPSNCPDIELVMRRVQVILRLYGDIGEVLTGFDVDCCCFAFDGKRVWGTERGLEAFSLGVNMVDLSRASRSYVSRMLKYADRG